MSAEALLARLDKVRKRGPGQYSACCSAHEDRKPSLSVRELPDGTVLLKCWAGCSVADIVAAVGLELHDLFPPRPQPGHGHGPAKPRRLLSAGQALELLHDEAHVIAVAGLNAGHGVELSDEDRARVLRAAARIVALYDEVRA
jgi:hypothetical protein